ncbi:MAG: branched chain amino acid aminotransferase [Chloroflexi bacterium RBG_16_68_14]|nr:MAG: branched chain amino acid aminotransferase [Chloroflexi bacterium RBG_16_68_14]
MATPTAYFQRRFVPLEDAKIGIMTHAFLYGTACFEGIRGNWNEDDGCICLFRMPEHYQRLRMSCRILRIDLPYTEDELCDLTRELVARSGYAEDVYVRPIAYKSAEVIGPRMHDVQDDFLIFVMPFGPYLDADAGIRCMTSTWRRVDDLGIPARAKVNGLYVNSALAKTEAQENGFDEAIMLDERGHVSEGSGENIFIVRRGALITPSPSDNILEGITRDSVITLARDELGIETIERPIDRSELYVADECFMTGTAAHVTAVVEVDRRPVGDGATGEITRRLQQLYFEAMRGKNGKYAHWVTPVKPQTAADRPAGRQGVRA